MGLLLETGIIAYGKARRLLETNMETYRNPDYEKRGIKVCRYLDDEYPAMLRDIYDPPILLYYKGTITSKRCIAVVGSRKCSEMGMQRAREISAAAASEGFCVVSGMARGIDSSAHNGALQNGSTTAVLGCGPDICYPLENKALMALIEQSGCIISEYAPGIRPDRYRFPARNRIISGMSEAVIVVEAEKKSGALITVEFGLDQGKDIYAVDWKGEIHSEGTTGLLEDGAEGIDGIPAFIERIKAFQ
ncbi:MAG: DNA-processing protein DprA [Clostridia bacterium]|nr:DNA-processing protein DprA [Clostridia bacterium]